MAKWISHRGIRRNCAENSETAFRQAVTAGFTWLETDLRSSADGVLVLSHDPCLNRVFGVDRAIESMPIAEILKVRDKFGGSVLQFSEFAERFADSGWVLDIKNETAARVISSLSSTHYALINSRLKDNVKFLFWNAEHQKRCLNIFPEADCFAQEKECWRAGLAALAGLPWLNGVQPQKTYSLPPTFLQLSLYNRRIFETYFSKGAQVLAYLPDTVEQARIAVDLGCTYVLANTDLFNN